MVGSSKILTVSYGTFSCTLEGFDDSFSTMKAISEYFRDLAADDRYFGAEPPTPDAEMLARIAEREISRRVEARTGDNGTGIVLRAATSLAGPDQGAAAAPDATPQDEMPAAAATEMPASPSLDLADDTAVPEQDIVTPDVAHAAETVAHDVAPAMPPAATPPSEVTPVTLPEVDTSTTDDTVAEDETLTFADMAPVAETVEVPAHPDAESVAAKLQRIRAVVGKAAPDAPAAEYAEDQHARDDAAPAADAQSADQLEADIDTSDEMDMTDVADTLEDAPQEVVEESVVGTADADLDAATAIEEEAEVAEVEVEDASPDVAAKETPAIPPVRARIVRMRKDAVVATTVVAAPATADKDLIANVLGTDADEQSDAKAEALADSEAASAEVETDFVEETVEVTDLEAEDEIASDADLIDMAALDGVEDLMGSANDDELASDLSAEDEAELLEELAEVEAEQSAPTEAALSVAEMADGVLADEVAPALDADATADDAATSVEAIDAAIAATDDAAEAPRHGRDILPEPDDAAMSRIMSQTDEALSEPEGSRRRNAIAQLKAAVAATEAARQLGDQNTEKAETETAFREDLKDAVRPQRPARPTHPVLNEEARTERPRPAPLKLVASQRVDAPEVAKDAAPVLPRRVAMAAEAAATDAGSFAEFADEMGATELPDLLEAAAAYTAFVEGVEDFSRPQIMKKVQLTTEQAFSREDGLRSFGTLLRQGRISKVRNGRFQVSEQTRFRPEQRAG